MFDLEQSIAQWRRQMLEAGIKTPVPLEELEIHLRDEIEQQIKSGLNQSSAFEMAVRNLGPAHLVQDEFEKQALKPRGGLFFMAFVVSLGAGLVVCACGLLFMRSSQSFYRTCGLVVFIFSLLGTAATFLGGVGVYIFKRKSFKPRIRLLFLAQSSNWIVLCAFGLSEMHSRQSFLRICGELILIVSLIGMASTCIQAVTVYFAARNRRTLPHS